MIKTIEMETDVLVVGGGTAGPMAAVKAKEKNPKLRVMLLEKANVKRSGAISMGMDGLNNAVLPGHATPEQYTKEITIANDGIVNQKTVYAYAANSARTIDELDDWEGLNFDLIVSLSPEAHHKALDLTRTLAATVEYWPVPDPSLTQGTRDQVLEAYRDVRDHLVRQIQARLKLTA